MRIIIESIEPAVRKRYDYDNLEYLYVNHIQNRIDDSSDIAGLSLSLKDTAVLVLAPGKTLETHKDVILKFIDENNVTIISANFIPIDYQVNFAFFSNQKRLERSVEFRNNMMLKTSLILTSNIKSENMKLKSFVINYGTLIKRNKWKYFDNAIILLIRLLIVLDVKKVILAGIDGFTSNENYAYNNQFLDANISKHESAVLNSEMRDMLNDIIITSKRRNFLQFITPSLYEVKMDIAPTSYPNNA
jgi:4-hydroxy 2-oxovalerate aldolase